MTRRRTRNDLKRARDQLRQDRMNLGLRQCAQQNRRVHSATVNNYFRNTEIMFTNLRATPQTINPRHRGAVGSVGFNSRNLSLRFASSTDVAQPQLQVLCDDRYIGIPIVKRGFVERQGLTTWERPGILVKMRNDEILRFTTVVLLTAAHQGVGYYGEVVVAGDDASFYKTNGWKTQFDGTAPDLVFTKTFLNSDNKIVPQK